jgi:hypothetical protein
VFVLELLHRVEGRIAAGDPRDRRVQSAAGDQQQREARTGLLIMNADGAFLEKAYDGSSLPGDSIVSLSPFFTGRGSG